MIKDVKTTIWQGEKASDETASLIRSVRGAIDQARSLTNATTHDSQHRDVRDGMRLLSDASREAELVLRRLRDSIDEAEAYIRTLG